MLSGCTIPTEYATGVFADVWEGRLVLVVNHAGAHGERFAIYVSDEGALCRWERRGVYSGRAACAAVLAEELWVFFREGRARRYPLGAGGSNDGRPERLPFDWTPEAACRDERGALWVVGRNGEGAAVTARLEPGGSPEWETGFPALPGPGRAPKALGAASSGERPRATGPGLPRLRAAAGGGLYVLWSVRRGDLPPGAVRGGRLVPAGPDSPPEDWRWEGLPDLEGAHSDFCILPLGRLAPRLLLREPPTRLTGRPSRRLLQVSPAAGAWSAPEVSIDSDSAFIFDYAPGASCVRWKEGVLLARTDRQRVELLVDGEGTGHWRALVPASALRLRLGEVRVLLTIAGAAALVFAGLAGFALELARIGAADGRGSRDLGMGPSPRAILAAPVATRVLAAAIDLALAGGVTLWAAGTPLPSADPLVPGVDSLSMHALVLGVLAVYGALFEGLLGATPGKLALGLRVARAGGGPAGFARVLVRNLLRPVDLFPPFLGAVGLGFMALTRSRRRLGDIAAGTAVVSIEEASERGSGSGTP